MKQTAQVIPLSPGEISLNQALKSFLMDCEARNLSRRTIDWYEERIGYFIEFLNMRIPAGAPQKADLKWVTLENIRLFTQFHKEREHRRKQGSTLSSYTVRGTVVGLKVFIKYLFNEGYLNENLALRIKSPKIQKKIIQTLSQEQIKMLLEAPNKKTFVGFRNYCMLLTLLDTGIRLGEMVNLKIPNVDFRINSMVVLGKGNKERKVLYGMSLRKVLEKYLTWRGDISNQDIVFVSQYGEKMKNRRVEEIVEDYGKKAGITGVRMSPHTLRHTFAKMSILNGMDAITLQYMLGHTSLEMVKNYVHLTSQEIAIHKNRFSLIDRMEIKGLTQRKKIF